MRKAEINVVLEDIFALCVYTRGKKTLERATGFSVAGSRYSSSMAFKNSDSTVFLQLIA